MGHFRKHRLAGIRKKDHDYRSKCIYHIVLMKAAGIADFSSVVGEIDSRENGPRAVPTVVGEVIAEALRGVKRVFPHIWIRRRCIMPDHVHLCLFVREATDVHLGKIILELKKLCTQLAGNRWGRGRAAGTGERGRAAGTDELRADGEEAGDEGMEDMFFFQAGYYDQILRGKGQLKRMEAYISDNPRRHLLRKAAPGWHRRFRLVDAQGRAYEAYGNWDLLEEAELEAVVIRSHFTAEKLLARKRRWYQTVLNDGVLVSPFISQDEKRVRDWANKEEGALIIVTSDVFGERYHPSGWMHEACSEGRLLLVSAPQPADKSRRAHCLFMNDLATDIAGGKLEAQR